jgi:hypothetical protein
MLEELEAGAIVIKGNWLSYPDLEQIGICFCSIPEIKFLTDKICYIINNFDSVCFKASQNKGVTELLNWEKTFPFWYNVVL